MTNLTQFCEADSTALNALPHNQIKGPMSPSAGHMKINCGFNQIKGAHQVIYNLKSMDCKFGMLSVLTNNSESLNL